MKKQSIVLLIGMLSFTACKKEEEKTAKVSDEFDYVFSAESDPLSPFPLLSSTNFMMKLLSGKAQAVKIKLTLPDGIKCWIKDSVMLPDAGLEVSFALTKPLVAGTYTYTVETSSPGTETRVFTGKLIRPKQECAPLYAGTYAVREECVDSLGSEAEYNNYDVSLVRDPEIDNMLIIENFKGNPAWNAQVITQCDRDLGRDPDSRPKFVLYKTNATDTVTYFYGRMEPSKLTINYHLYLNGRRRICNAVYTR